MSQEKFKLKVLMEDGEIHIHGNRAALKNLADACAALCELSDEEAKTAANHFHYADYMNSAAEGSIALMV